MKRIVIAAAALTLLFTGCAGRTAADEDAAAEAYQVGYETGYADGYRDGVRLTELAQAEAEAAKEQTVTFSGSFTATVGTLIPDYCALPGTPVAVLHFFQDGPFLLNFHEDMTGKLEPGETYVFTFEPFDVTVPSDVQYLSIEDYMDKVKIISYRIAEEGETGVNNIMPDTAFQE